MLLKSLNVLEELDARGRASAVKALGPFEDTHCGPSGSAVFAVRLRGGAALRAPRAFLFALPLCRGGCSRQTPRKSARALGFFLARERVRFRHARRVERGGGTRPVEKVRNLPLAGVEGGGLRVRALALQRNPPTSVCGP